LNKYNPSAHLFFSASEYTVKTRWITESELTEELADFVAQNLPRDNDHNSNLIKSSLDNPAINIAVKFKGNRIATGIKITSYEIKFIPHNWQHQVFGKYIKHA
jgi:hypothetical protein